MMSWIDDPAVRWWSGLFARRSWIRLVGVVTPALHVWLLIRRDLTTNTGIDRLWTNRPIVNAPSTRHIATIRGNAQFLSCFGESGG
jgi:hypothetical protein